MSTDDFCYLDPVAVDRGSCEVDIFLVRWPAADALTGPASTLSRLHHKAHVDPGQNLMDTHAQLYICIIVRPHTLHTVRLYKSAFRIQVWQTFLARSLRHIVTRPRSQF